MVIERSNHCANCNDPFTPQGPQEWQHAGARGRRQAEPGALRAEACVPFSVGRVFREVTIVVGRPVLPPRRASFAECALGSVDAPSIASRSSPLAFRSSARAFIRRFTSRSRFSDERSGLARRQRRPRTTKYRPSGVRGCGYSVDCSIAFLLEVTCSHAASSSSGVPVATTMRDPSGNGR